MSCLRNDTECLLVLNVSQNDALSQFEIASSSCSILNSVTPGALPFDPFDPAAGSARDEVRMRYRYLDLRGTIGENIRLRSKVSWAVRDMFHKNGMSLLSGKSKLIRHDSRFHRN